MVKKLKRCFAESKSRTVVLLAFVCAAICLAIGFSHSPRLYPLDYGQYEPVLLQCGLDWTDADKALGDLQYARPILEFRYTHFSWASLFSMKAGVSTVYAVALIRLFTESFGVNFSVNAVAALWAVLLALGCGILTAALYDMMPRGWYLPGALLCILFLDGNFCAIFRSLYPQAAAIAFSLLAVAVILRAWSVDPKRRSLWLIPAILLSMLALKASSAMIVFLPLMLAANIGLVFSCRKHIPKKHLVVVLCAVLLSTGTESAVQLLRSDADSFSNPSLYEASFNCLLVNADHPEEILAEWGLDDSYLADIGKSYYEPEDSYANNPSDEKVAEVLFSRITPSGILRAYMKRPGLFLRALNASEVSFGRGFENTRNTVLSPNEKGFSANRVDGGVFALLWKIMPYSWTAFFVFHSLLMLVALGLALRRHRAVYLLLFLYALGCVLYLPFELVLDGYAQSQQYMLIQVLLVNVTLAGLLCVVANVLPVIRQWITRYTDDAYVIEPRSRSLSAGRVPYCLSLDLMRPGISRLSANRIMVLMVTFVLCAAILMSIYLPATHPASINNGDFGRMMEQLDVTWEGMLFFDTDDQAGQHAVENYAYSKGFDLLKLTPFKPTYSLYWFAAIVRLFTEPFGNGFSTYLLAWVMSAITLLCILRIIWDLQPLLGNWILPAVVLLCAMLMNETYLTWYNSLYGEGCILLGLLLTSMCTLRLCLMSREWKWRKALWFAGLIVSLYILIMAKSQMLMAMPGAVVLLLILAWYHRPYRYDIQVLWGLIVLALSITMVFSSWGVYQSDRSDGSVSQRHTMWQAYFYGIFMISDDPIADMEALGVDTAMAPDIGKFVSFAADAEYVYAPLSPEADAAFYDHVNTFTILKWYLTHPAKLWYMLDHAAAEAKELYTGFRVYLDQDYSDPGHVAVNGWNLWPLWRSSLTPGSFIGYVLFYGALLAIIAVRMARKKATAQQRILYCLPLFLIVTGVLQYPMSVLGNGFADNQKQLFCFSLCHDLLLGGSILLGVRWLYQLPKDAKLPGIRQWLRLKKRGAGK